MGGHESYANFRSLGEAISAAKSMLGESESDSAEVAELEAQLAKLMTERKFTECAALQEKIDDHRSRDAEIASLEAQLPGLMKARNFVECAAVQDKIDSLKVGPKKTERRNSLTLQSSIMSPVKQPSKEAAMDLSYLDEYPSIPLSEYHKDDSFWFINKNYPGLRAVHKDPWIFLVPNLLDEGEFWPRNHAPVPTTTPSIPFRTII